MRLDPLWGFASAACLGAIVCSTAVSRGGARRGLEEGFVAIFDGKTLQGWRVVPREATSDWTVRDGVVVGHGSAKRLCYLVWRDDHLRDFELRLRYRLPGKGNTGIEIRARPDPTGKRPFVGYHADLGHVGIGAHILGAWDFHFARRREYPCPRGTRLVIDEDGKPHASRIPGAVTLADIRPHQWNDVRVVARGYHFQFFINGKLSSEFTDNARTGRLGEGAIGLQIHDKGMTVEFKDIRLKRLAPTGNPPKKPKAGGGEAMNQPTTTRKRYLLLDARIVERAENAKLTLGKVVKSDRNPLMAEDKPWEKRFDNLYANIIYDRDDKLYKCWYSPFVVDRSAKGMSLEDRRKSRYRPPRGRQMAICYATSRDGIVWEKPELGLVEYEGSKRNNIVWRGPHGAGVFKDPREPDPSRRYKAFFKSGRMSVAFSPDGLHWTDAIPCAGLAVAGDTHNNALWAPTLGKFVGFTRTWGRQGRQVARTESDDFLNWTKAEVVLQGLDRRHQTYAMPVFFHGGVYLGLLAVIRTKEDRVWTELAWSPDTLHWHRVCPGTPLIPNSEKEMAYDWGCIYAAAYPIFLEDEIRIYYGGSDWHHGNWRCGYLCLATLRPDGFAAYEPADADDPARITTTPIACAGERLKVTADVSPGGAVQVAVLDEKERQLAEARQITRTVTDAPLRWNNGFSLAGLGGKRVRLRFLLRRARLYSFAFSD